MSTHPKRITAATMAVGAAGLAGTGYALGKGNAGNNRFPDSGYDQYYKSAGLADKIRDKAVQIGIKAKNRPTYALANAVHDHPVGAAVGAGVAAGAAVGGAYKGIKKLTTNDNNKTAGSMPVFGGNNMFEDIYGQYKEAGIVGSAIDKVRGAGFRMAMSNNKAVGRAGQFVFDHPQGVAGGAVGLGAAGLGAAGYGLMRNKQASFEDYGPDNDGYEASFDDIELAKQAALELVDDAMAKLAYAEDLHAEAEAVEYEKVAAFENTKARFNSARDAVKERASRAYNSAKGGVNAARSLGMKGTAKEIGTHLSEAQHRAIAYAKANPKKVLGVAGGAAAAAGGAAYYNHSQKKEAAEKIASEALEALQYAQDIYNEAEYEKIALDNGGGSHVEVGNNLLARATQSVSNPITAGNILSGAAGAAAGAAGGAMSAQRFGLGGARNMAAMAGGAAIGAAAGLAGGTTVGGKLNDFINRHAQNRIMANAAANQG